MTMPGKVLEHHTLVVRDGRILDLLPSSAAAGRYTRPPWSSQRPAHLLMPGMINARHACRPSLLRGAGPGAAALEQRFLGPEFVRDGALTADRRNAAIGHHLLRRSLLFSGRNRARRRANRACARVIGLPVADTASPWAQTSAEYLTEGAAACATNTRIIP